ncbi:MAG TPA: sialidase family protein [Candidatus Hydrogenedentes bacterium]|nr:sialidase family protein [Candidatus Hydrogenedentota bacterium]HRT21500.1 sialidase family protein [Candidatus Hydrogenedentota bacterium]HRT66204.1 sialidase family protein [Candidatus Hydrogenedentota bacterium]
MLLAIVLAGLSASGDKPDFSLVPGVVINHIPASEQRYVGSPALAVLADGAYVASHDEFGPKSQYHSNAVSHIFRSDDKGLTWRETARIEGAFWSSLFVHRGALYLLGTHREYGNILIRRSDDGGATWTVPRDADSGLIAQGEYHCAPMPVIEHKGRLWRGMEDAAGGDKWGHRFRALMMSVKTEADLLKAKSWRFSNCLARNPEWLGGAFNAWLEGNAVVTPKGDIVDILRVDITPKMKTEHAAIVRVSAKGRKASFDPDKDFIPFPGGSKKFAIRWDPQTKKYWSLVNYIPEKHQAGRPASTRNTLALASSPDLRAWTIQCVLLYHPDVEKHGFQYVDWLFESGDIIAVCRTAFDDGLGGAHNMHDANFLTFHRFKNFRTLTLDDSVPGWRD